MNPSEQAIVAAMKKGSEGVLDKVPEDRKRDKLVMVQAVDVLTLVAIIERLAAS